MGRDPLKTSPMDKPYVDAGHDLESLYDVKTYNKCKKCGSYLIDLAEDLVYGEMRKCKTH